MYVLDVEKFLDVCKRSNALTPKLEELIYANTYCIDKDLVEVVRCEKCKYHDGMSGQPNILCYQMHEDDFCSYGAPKTDSES